MPDDKKKDILFEELNKKERILLLSAFDYDVDEKGYILKPSGEKIPSKETPDAFIKVESAMLVPGSLEVMDGTPTAISKFIRENMESSECLRQ